MGESFFTTNGTSDQAWYQTPSGNGSPASTGFETRLTYLPWENTQFTLQYTAYSKFDGQTAGASRSNSLYILAWFLW